MFFSSSVSKLWLYPGECFAPSALRDFHLFLSVAVIELQFGQSKENPTVSLSLSISPTFVLLITWEDKWTKRQLTQLTVTLLFGFWFGNFVWFLNNWYVEYTKRLFLSLIKKILITQEISGSLIPTQELLRTEWRTENPDSEISSYFLHSLWLFHLQPWLVALVPSLSIPRLCCCSHLGCKSWSPSCASESNKNEQPKVKSRLDEELVMEWIRGPEDSKTMWNASFSSTWLAPLSGFWLKQSCKISHNSEQLLLLPSLTHGYSLCDARLSHNRKYASSAYTQSWHLPCQSSLWEGPRPGPALQGTYLPNNLTKVGHLLPGIVISKLASWISSLTSVHLA